MKRVLGVLLVSVSLVILVVTYFPLAETEINYQLDQLKESKIEEVPPVDTDFGIVIPKLKINSRVIKNVNPFDANIYQKALTKGVAHAKGTALPGENGNIFIFSHSSENFYEATRYNSIFYLLPKLEIGDTITLYYENKQYDYHVSEKKIIRPDELSYLRLESDTPQLTLMTCYPAGTNFKRFIIVAN
jgi:sortase A